MRASASGRIFIRISHVTVAFVIHVTEGAFPVSECLLISGFLFLVFSHPAFSDRSGKRYHARFPFCGITPVIGHAADFIGIGIVSCESTNRFSLRKGKVISSGIRT